jgi:hypothetical protein
MPNDPHLESTRPVAAHPILRSTLDGLDYSNIISLSRLSPCAIFSPRPGLCYGRHEALTLSEWFYEHFIDSAVYLAGALRWIAISTKS